MAIIYGVDTTKPITPGDVRDAIVECFFLAHKEALEDMGEYAESLLPEELEEAKRDYIKQLVRKFFQEVNGDYDKPTKESILRVLEKLKEFAAHFRKPEVIEKHYNEIMRLVNNI